MQPFILTCNSMHHYVRHFGMAMYYCTDAVAMAEQLPYLWRDKVALTEDEYADGMKSTKSMSPKLAVWPL